MQTMATNRLEILEQMIAADPANTFARYGLAMEHSKSGDYRTAVTEFQSLLATDPDYAAAYYHCGQALEKLGEVEEARAVYERGVEATIRKGDTHTRSEIEAALSLLPV